MKKLFTLILSSIILATVEANPIGQETALQQAQLFMKQQGKSVVLQEVQTSSATRGSGQKDNLPYYIFNAGNQQGFVIVSGDDCTHQILGYAEKGSFDIAHIPAGLQYLLDSYADQISRLGKTRAASEPVNRQPIAPMITSKWDQIFPYNLKCPVTPDGQETWTGCVATAMAQVMYYHKWPKQTTQAIPGYTTWSWGMEMPEIGITTIDWENILPVYDATATDVQDNAVATLMQLCGTALTMDYDPVFSGSGTPSIPPALTTYFDYDHSIRTVGRAAYKLDDWNQLIYDELAAGRPVVYNGSSAGGAHAFVINGYKSDDLFYVNWGWGGWCDGYFLLSVLDPGSTEGAGASTSSDGYSFWQGAIIGIQPNKGTQPEPARLTTTYACASDGGSNPVDNQEFERGSAEEEFLTILHSENSYSDYDTEFEMTWGLYDDSDNLVSVCNVDDTGEKTKWYSTNGYSYWASGAHYIRVGENISNGTYVLKTISRLVGTENWYANIGTDKYYITATIEGNKLTLKNAVNEKPAEPVIQLSGSFDSVSPDPAMLNKPVTVKATINNLGDEFIGDIFFFVNGNLQGGKCIEAAVGGSTSAEFTFTPNTFGELQLALSRDHDNGSEPFATGTVNIIAPEANLSLTPTIKYIKDGIVGTKAVTVSLHITNNDSKPYDNNVLAVAYKYRNDGSGYGDYATEAIIPVLLEAGGNTDVEMILKDAENDASYFIIAYYVSKGDWVRGSQETPEYTVRLQPASLQITPSVANADNNGIVEGINAVFNYHITNNGATAYDNVVIAKVFKLRDDNSGYGDFVTELREIVSINPNASQDVNLTFDKAEDSASYFFWCYYISDGDEVVGADYTPFFTFKYSTAIRTANAATAQDAKGIYTLDGRQVSTETDDAEQTLRQLPKGIYIVNGKKVRN